MLSPSSKSCFIFINFIIILQVFTSAETFHNALVTMQVPVQAEVGTGLTRKCAAGAGE